MADAEERRQRLKDGLESVPTLTLMQIRTLAFDRYTWDTDSEADRDWFEVCDEILRGRPEVSNTGENDITLRVEKLVAEDVNNPGIPQTVFEMSGGQIQPGFEFQFALFDKLAQEIQWGGLTYGGGMTLGDLIKQKAVEAVREQMG